MDITATGSRQTSLRRNGSCNAVAALRPGKKVPAPFTLMSCQRLLASRGPAVVLVEVQCTVFLSMCTALSKLCCTWLLCVEGAARRRHLISRVLHRSPVVVKALYCRSTERGRVGVLFAAAALYVAFPSRKARHKVRITSSCTQECVGAEPCVALCTGELRPGSFPLGRAASLPFGLPAIRHSQEARHDSLSAALL